MRVLLCCTVALITFAFALGTFAAGTSAPAAGSAVKPAEPPPDPLGRTTPYGTVIGFLRAVDAGDYKTAARYLEGRQSAQEKEERAHHLAVVLNRGLKLGVEDLSKAPEGRLDDNLSPYLENVGTATYGSRSLEIVLRRTTKADIPALWLFSSETLFGVAVAAEELDLAWAEAVWPESFREIRVFAYPLFRLINLSVALLVTLGAAWLVTLTLIRLLRPWARRQSALYGELAIARVQGLLWLLIFAVMARFVGAQSITVSGRIFFDSVARVLVIVAVCWLLVRVTRLAARVQTHHLRQVSAPGKIAGVELFSWLLVCVWGIAGLFLVLRSFGVEPTAAIAGLGVGTIAVAFAAQKTLENLFGTVMVVSDEVVKVGDACQAGTVEGRVESIGLRSTRIRTLDRTVVSIPNGQLAAMSIGNFARRDKFLFRHNIRLRYGTTADELRAVLSKITRLMSGHPRLERSTIRTRLVRFGDASLELEAFAYVLTDESEVFLEIQEELLLRIMDVVEASGSAIAAPARPAVANGRVASVT